MPIYEYCCLECKAEFEELVSMNRQDMIDCPRCGSNRTKRLPSLFGFVSRSGGVTNGGSHSSSCGSCRSGDCGSCSG